MFAFYTWIMLQLNCRLNFKIVSLVLLHMGFITGQITVAKCCHHARVVWMCHNFLPFRWRSSYLARSWETFSITRSYSPFDFCTSSCNYNTQKCNSHFYFLSFSSWGGGVPCTGSLTPHIMSKLVHLRSHCKVLWPPPPPHPRHIQTCSLWSTDCWKVGDWHSIV